VVTAWHVVQEKPDHVVVRQGNVVFVTQALQHDDITDVAILGDSPKLEFPGIDLVSDDDNVAVADPVYIAGFPDGWPGDSPIGTTGSIAGIDGEMWVSADTTWGHSGGPICILDGPEPRLAGIVLGRAGSVRRDLEELVNSLSETAQKLRSAMGGAHGGFVIGSAHGALSLGDFATFAGDGLARISGFVGLHFRTGYTRAATSAEIRRLLAP
jgi:hypothetical protein